jgi:hypothetical protein
MLMITDFNAGVFLISLTLSRWTRGSPRDNSLPRIRAESVKDHANVQPTGSRL